MNKLKERRFKLYYQFDNVSNSLELYELQLNLAKEIIETERSEQLNNIDKGYHLDRVLAIGDAIVWKYIHPFTIRQLGNANQERINLSNQIDFLNNIETIKNDLPNEIIIFSDLTKCITIGDAIRVVSFQKVDIIELKSGNVENSTPKDILKGRNGRQVSKAFWIQEYLNNDIGKFFNEDKVKVVLKIETEPIYRFEVIEKLFNNLNSEHQSVEVVDQVVLYFMSRLNENEDLNFEILKDHLVMDLDDKIVFATTARLVENYHETYLERPVLAFPNNIVVKSLLNEVDYIIMGFLNVTALNRLLESKGIKIDVDENGLINFQLKGRQNIFHNRFLNNVLYGFLSIDSLIEMLVEMINKHDTDLEHLQSKVLKYDENRPNTFERFLEHIKDYNFEKSSRGGKVILTTLNNIKNINK